MIKIDILNENKAGEYEEFILKSDTSLFYASNKYRIFLREFLGAKDNYFIAVDENGQIQGALPSFMKENERLGNVLNSLPFYGSNGGVIEYKGNPTVKKALLQGFYSFAEENNCSAVTIISSPLASDREFYEQNIDYNYSDERIGQFTVFPLEEGNVDELLMSKFDSVRRRNIRKALKSGITISDAFSKEAMEFLISTHTENIKALGGIVKPRRFFDLLPQFFEYGTDYKVFTASKDNKFIAALLLFYFNKTVEYFTPVIVESYRTYQPLSLIVFEAMKDACSKGFKRWNWGGTWIDQEGVYRFKKKWGAQDFLYYYYTKVYSEKVSSCTREELLQEYPYFYVLPFAKLIPQQGIELNQA